MAKVLTIVSTGAKAAVTEVRGVKGAAETQYRDGYVNITPENIGFTIVEVENSTGTLSAEELEVLKDNLYNYIGYSPDGIKRYIFKLTSASSTNLQYSVVKEDLTGIMVISVDTVTGDYLYSYEESHIETQIGQILLDATSGTLTNEQYAEVEKEYCFIKYNNNLYYKDTNNISSYIFRRFNVNGYTQDFVLENETFTITKETKAYVYNQNTIQAYNNTGVTNLLDQKQNVIDSTHKLSSDLVDDINAINKFVTAEEKTQITTNKNDISSIKNGTSINSFGQVESALELKTDKATTYTKTEVDGLLNGKQDTLSGSESIDITSNVVSVKQSYIDSQFLTDAEMTTLISEVFD